MIWLLRKIFILFSSETSPAQLSAGIAFGILLGLMPIQNLVWVSVLLLVLLLRVNLSLTLVFFCASKGLYLLFYPLIDAVGTSVLKSGSLEGLFTSMYNTPVVAISGYNVPTVMGGLVIGTSLFIVLFPVGIYVIKLYRTHILSWLEKFWLMRVIKGSGLYQWYSRIMG